MTRELDITVPSRPRFQGKQYALSDEACRLSACRRIAHMRGARALAAWAETEPQPMTQPATYNAHAFWHTVRTVKRSASGVRAPDIFVEGLRSASRVGRLRVHLWTYEPCVNAPGDCVLSSASSLMPRETFDRALRDGWDIRILSDIIRMRAVAAGGGGFVLDGDTCWVRAASVPWGPPAYGHLFASMEARREFRGGVAKLTKSWASTRYLRAPMDWLYLATPWHFPAGSPALRQALSAAESLLPGSAAAPAKWDFWRSLSELVDAGPVPEPPMGDNQMMNAVRLAIITWGLEPAIKPAREFSPLSNSLQNLCHKPVAPLDLSGVTAVNAYWSSTRWGAHDAVQRGSLAECNPLSRWGRVRAAVAQAVEAAAAPAAAEAPEAAEAPDSAAETAQPLARARKRRYRAEAPAAAEAPEAADSAAETAQPLARARKRRHRGKCSAPQPPHNGGDAPVPARVFAELAARLALPASFAGVRTREQLSWHVLPPLGATYGSRAAGAALNAAFFWLDGHYWLSGAQARRLEAEPELVKEELATYLAIELVRVGAVPFESLSEPLKPLARVHLANTNSLPVATP